MAYVTLNGSITYNKAKFKPHDRQRVRVVKSTHNFTANAVPGADVVNMIPVPAESVILGAAVLVSDAQADTDILLGVTGDPDIFSGGTDTASTGLILPTITGTAHGNPYYTNAALNVVLTAVTNAINSAVIDVVVTYIEMDAMKAKN